MTRQEFIEEVTCIQDFYTWAYDNDEDWRIEGWFHDDDFGETVDNDIREFIDNYPWDSLRDSLNDVCTYSESGWYRYNGRLDYDPIEENELDDLKRAVLESDFVFDGEDDEEPDEEEDDAEEYTAPEPPINWRDDWDAVEPGPEHPVPVAQENPEERHAINVLLFGGEEE